ncbi:MAG: 2-phospho-L-lactate transferase [Chloroflexota bacterium]
MTNFSYPHLKVVALAGGVGGSKLVTGLAQLIAPENLTIIANTGDDFEHLGLWITPDLDTIMYRLAGVNNPETGWGRANPTWETMTALKALNGPGWFNLGDQDLANNLLRTHWRRQGYPLTWITQQLCEQYKVTVRLTPMTDSVVQTMVHTDQGEMAFQEYFVHRRCEPIISRLEYQGASEAEVSRELVQAIRMADLIVFAPSNPFLSIDPILSLPGIRRLITAASAPKIAVSPIIGGDAVRGPAAKIMTEFDLEVSAFGVGDYFKDILTGIVIDTADEVHQTRLDNLGLKTGVTQTLMKTDEDQQSLAQAVLHFGLSKPD